MIKENSKYFIHKKSLQHCIKPERHKQRLLQRHIAPKDATSTTPTTMTSLVNPGNHCIATATAYNSSAILQEKAIFE